MVSKNMKRATNWAFIVFESSRLHQEAFIPELIQFSDADVNKWLSKFVTEAKRQEGKPYPHEPFIIYVQDFCVTCAIIYIIWPF